MSVPLVVECEPPSNAETLNGSLIPGTSILGLDLKNELGLNDTVKCSAGML